MGASFPSFWRVTAVLLASIAYFGLAIWGEGGVAPFLAKPALSALLLSYGLIVAVSLFAGGNISSGAREDRGNRWVLVPFGVLGLANGFLPAWSDRVDFWTLDGDALRWVGVALYVVGGALRLWPVFVLGDRFSGLVAIQPGHRLVTTGVYAWVRNPSYDGLLLNSLGWSLAFRSGLGALVTALLIPPLVARIFAEERLLLSEFGGEYRDYRQGSWRLIPFLW